MNDRLTNSPGGVEAKFAALEGKIDRILPLLEGLSAGQNQLVEGQNQVAIWKNEFSAELTRLGAELTRLGADLTKFRGFVLGKFDGLQSTVELVREDIRNAWSTADFAIMNSRHAREDTNKIMELLSTMQKQQQTLASQVEELRKREAERGHGM